MNLPTLRNKYKNKIDLVDKILKIYAISQDIALRNFERQMLVYYIIYDYGQEAKDILKEDTGKRQEQIRVSDTYLRRQGFLVQCKNNMRMSELSPDMESIRDSFVKKNKKIYVLTFETTK